MAPLVGVLAAKDLFERASHCAGDARSGSLKLPLQNDEGFNDNVRDRPELFDQRAKTYISGVQTMPKTRRRGW